ncbi:alpha/beta fold hydrolase [Actinophytocola xanthii]|uniref:Transporter n=1 Tax=Actinophytocola xanthii TaxID=1912961 RepID=A0A1Q8CU27_9PSEU|nr:alpha/beta fold hydrolase [Actinophytocola xanthii]OLF17865.1 transporter [Actinophytocola xanthii]
MRRLIGGTLTAAVLLTGVAVPAGAAVDPFDTYDNQQLVWGPCQFEPVESAPPAECALVTVPRDWARPGAELRVSISRVAATGERLGALLVNPGGPGVQGTSLAPAVAAFQPSVAQRYDIIGMDPRGTGQEGNADLPGFACEVPKDRLSTWTDLDARDRSRDSIAEHRKAPRAYAEACQSEALTPYVTTWQTAHDMELVRRLLGDTTLNYLGYSYGTWLGAKYASLFPDSAGKLVLDSSVNWQGRLQAAFEDWPMINQRHFEDMFLPWMSRQFPEIVGATPQEAASTWERARAYVPTVGVAPDTYDSVFTGMGSQIRWVFGALLFTLAAQEMNGEQPPPASSSAVSGRLDTMARETFGVPMSELTVRRVAAALDEDDYLLVSGTRYAVACGDQVTRSAAWYRRLSDRQGPRYPLFGWAYGLGEPCGYWSDAPRQALPTLPRRVAGNVLVIQGELDPQTGYEQARAAVRAAPGVSMVSVDDAAYHGQYAFEENPCVDGMVNVFLLRNSRPGNATCPGVPLPGESRVYPVDGPVESGPASRSAARTPPSRLQEEVRDRISTGNRPF